MVLEMERESFMLEPSPPNVIIEHQQNLERQSKILYYTMNNKIGYGLNIRQKLSCKS